MVTDDLDDPRPELELARQSQKVVNRATYKVGIVGLGVAGGALAVMLARQGHSVTVFERAERLSPVGAGLLLQPSGQSVLSGMDLLGPVVRKAVQLHGIRAFLRSGKRLVWLDYRGASPEKRAYGVRRGDIFEALHTAAQEAKVEIRSGHDIVDWRTVADGVVAVDSKNEDHGPFDFLAVCDGSKSQLRQRIDPRCRTHEYAYSAIWAEGPCTTVHDHLRQTVDGTRRLLGILPTGDSRATLFWGLRADQYEAVVKRGLNAWRDESLALEPLATSILTGIDCFDQLIFARYRHARPRRLFDQRVVLVGDAAHASSPHLGQGANLALLDAQSLALALARSPEPLAAFADYVSERRRQVRFYSTLSWLLAPFFQSDLGALGWVRNLALPLMCRTPIVRRQMEKALAGVKRGLFTSMEI